MTYPSAIPISGMLPEILLPFLKRTFSLADRFCWLSFTFDKDKQLVTCRRGRGALLDRLSFVPYVVYVVLLPYGILWHNDTSNPVTKLNSALFALSYVPNLLITLYWEADKGIPHLLNIISKRTIDPARKNGKISDSKLVPLR